MSAVFIAVQAAVEKKHLAPAVSMLYLAQGLGAVVGIAGSSAVFQAGLRATLEGRLIRLHLDSALRDEVLCRYSRRTQSKFADRSSDHCECCRKCELHISSEGRRHHECHNPVICGWSVVQPFRVTLGVFAGIYLRILAAAIQIVVKRL